MGLTAEAILTDGGPSDSKARALKETTGWRPYSIRVGDMYVPYRKYLGPLAPLIATYSNIYATGHALSEDGMGKAVAGSVFGLAEAIADESWMKGVANFVDAARNWDRDGEKYLRNLTPRGPYPAGRRARSHSVCVARLVSGAGYLGRTYTVLDGAQSVDCQGRSGRKDHGTNWGIPGQAASQDTGGGVNCAAI